MSPFLSTIALFGIAGLTAACGSDSDAARSGGVVGTAGGAGTSGTSAAADASDLTPIPPPACGSGTARLCAPAGFPFVEAAAAPSDSCPPPVSSCPPLTEIASPEDPAARLSQPEAGVLCLTGTVKPGGWAQLGLSFPAVNQARTRILETFNARALGITGAAFTITSPPRQGLGVVGATTRALECASMDQCSTYGFALMTAPDSGVPVRITEPGPSSALFANFRQTDPTQGDPGQIFDTSALQLVAFTPGVGPYDFCVRDFRFVDINGDEVKP
jgi:hypothetical protein